MQAALLLEGLCLRHRHAHALGHRLGEVLAAHEQDADEAGHTGLVDDDVGDAGADVDQRLDSPLRPSWSVRPSERSTAKEERSTVVGVRPAFCAACTALRTISREAATSRPRSMRSPCRPVDLLQRVEVEHGVLDRHRDVVLHLEGRASFFSSSAWRHGRSTWRTITFWFATPMHDLLARELGVGPQLLDGSAYGLDVDDLAVAHGPILEGNLAELREGDLALAERKLGSANARSPDVETNGGSSCHDANPSRGQP